MDADGLQQKVPPQHGRAGTLLFGHDLEKDPMELVDRSNDADYLPVRLTFAEKLLTLRARHLDQTLAYTELTESGPVTIRPAL